MKRKPLIVGLVLVEVLICAGMALVVRPSLDALAAGEVRWRVFSFDTESATADEERRLEVSTPAMLVVHNAAGDVTVTAGTGNAIVVVAHKTAWAPTAAEAQAALAGLRVTITQQGAAVDVRVEQPGKSVIAGSIRADTVDLVIAVPAATAARLRTGYGDVTASGLQGDLAAETAFGGVTLEGVAGGEVLAHCGSGAVTLTDVTATGTVSVTTDFGDIALNAVRAATLGARTGSGRVTLTGVAVDGRATVDSSFGAVTSTHGRAASYDVHTGSGLIDIAGEFGEGPHTFRSDFGDIRLAVPEDAALTVDLHTEFGTIRSTLALTLGGELQADRWLGTLNGGGARLTASARSGNIGVEAFRP